jgi:hypothetical protein
MENNMKYMLVACHCGSCALVDRVYAVEEGLPRCPKCDEVMLPERDADGIMIEVSDEVQVVGMEEMEELPLL